MEGVKYLINGDIFEPLKIIHQNIIVGNIESVESIVKFLIIKGFSEIENISYYDILYGIIYLPICADNYERQSLFDELQLLLRSSKHKYHYSEILSHQLHDRLKNIDF